MRRLLPLLALALAIPTGSLPAAGSTDRLVIMPTEPGTLTTIEAHFPVRDDVCEAKQRRPVRARYRGTVEIIHETDGRLSIINEVTFGDYLAGIAEVPRSWPEETLRAQVIAARSYALYGMQSPPRSYRDRGFDICATDACQVYRGAPIELGAFGDRWRRAVDDTAGVVVMHGGRLAQTFYFSTSTGRTRTNADVWGSPPRPYLPSVDAHDEDSPVARWTVEVPFDDLDAILRAAGRWPGGGITGVDGGDALTVRGPAASENLTRGQMMSALNAEGPCLFPGRYPTDGSQHGTRLPLTVPSTHYTASTRDGRLVLEGRGWGHDVGMSQYGARAMAEQGATASEIIAHFYGGSTVGSMEEPGAIRVLALEHATEVRVRLEGLASVTGPSAGGADLAVAREFTVRGGDRLEIATQEGPILPPAFDLTATSAPAAAVPGSTIEIGFTLSSAARVRAAVTDGTESLAAAEDSFTSGDARIPLTLEGIPPGDYHIRLEATDGLDIVDAEPVALSVRSPQPPAPAQGAQPEVSAPWLAGLAALLLALAAGLWWMRRRTLG